MFSVSLLCYAQNAFFDAGRVLVVFPGGMAPWMNYLKRYPGANRKGSKLPILLFGKQFGINVINFDALVEDGMIDPDDIHLLQFVGTPEEADIIQDHFDHALSD